MSSPTSEARRATEAWVAKTELEGALEPGLPIVDPHVHLLQRDYTYFIEDYAKDIAESEHNVEAMVFAECHAMYRAHGPDHLKCVGETEFVVGQAAMAASEKYTKARVAEGIVGYADLTLGERTRETLEAHVAAGNGRFRGVRQRAKWDPDPVVRGPVSASGPGLYVTPEFNQGMKLLASMGLSFDASIFHPQLPDVVALARANPEASIVLIHSGSPVEHSSYADRKDEVRTTWLSGIRELAKCPNVTVKMGGLLFSLGGIDHQTSDTPPNSERLAEMWRPYIEPCIEILGADRCMASSNFPVDGAAMRYGTVWNAFKRITAGCSAEEKRQIYSGTSKRVYRLEGD